MKKSALVLTGGLSSSSVLGWIYYDHQTMHKMRSMSPWRPQESLIRFLNLATPEEYYPEFTLPGMRKYNGVDTPQVHFSAKGVVYDATGAEAFAPDGPYGQNWAGRDATIALAIMSLKPQDVNRQDWGVLTDKDRETLDSWISYFDEKYRRVGVLREYVNKEDYKRSGQIWMKENSAQDGVVSLPSGIQYKVLQTGPAGGATVEGDTTKCEVYYRGARIDGVEVMTNAGKKPLLCIPRHLLKGWREAIMRMREGDVWQVVVPSELGHGSQAAPGSLVRPHDVLVLEIELRRVKNPDAESTGSTSSGNGERVWDGQALPSAHMQRKAMYLNTRPKSAAQ